MRGAFIDTLTELAASDDRIWLMTGDLGFSVLEGFAAANPERYVNVGVAEQNMTGVAAGLALSGARPFTYSIANFPTLRCLEQIRNDIAYHGLGVTVVSVGGGLAYGNAGYTHHGVEDLAILRSIPGMLVVCPADPIEVRLATKAIMAQSKPVYLRLGKGGEPRLYNDGPPSFELGIPSILRQGDDVILAGAGPILGECIKAAAILTERNVQARVVSLHTLSDFDGPATIEALSGSAPLFLIEEHMGGSVHGALFENHLSQITARGRNIYQFRIDPHLRFCLGSREHLLTRANLSGVQIADRVLSILGS